MGKLKGEYKDVYYSLLAEYKKKYDIPWERFRKRPDNVNGYLFRRGALDVLGGKCIKCGFADWRALEIEHTDGDGKFDREVLGLVTRRLHQAICFGVIDLGKYQILCSNCHSIKTYESFEHTREPFRVRLLKFNAKNKTRKEDVKELKGHCQTNTLDIRPTLSDTLKNSLGLSQEQLFEVLKKIGAS